MTSHTTYDTEAEKLRFEELGPRDNAAARAMLYLCKNRGDDVNRMEDFWNAMLASYFPLTDGFMICRSTVYDFRTLTVAVAPKENITQLRVLLQVCFSHNDAEEPPFNALCKDNFQQGHGDTAIACMTMGATTYKPFLMMPPGAPGEECRRGPLEIEREGGKCISFGNRFHRMDTESDRKGLDEVFKILHAEGLGRYRGDMQEAPRQEQYSPERGPKATKYHEFA